MIILFDFPLLIMHLSNKLEQENPSAGQNFSPSRLNSVLTLRNPMKGRIKRQTGLFSRWKDRSFRITHTSPLEFTLTVERSGKVEENIDLLQAKLSKKCSTVEKNPCFGIVLPSGKKYLLGLPNEEDTRQLHVAISQEKKSGRIINSGLVQEKPPLKLEYQLSDKNEMEKESTYAHSPSKEEDLSEDYQPRRRSQAMGQEQESDIFCTVLSEEPISRPIQIPLTKMLPLSPIEQIYLDCDSGFKLQMNFPQGRILAFGQEVIKCSLLVNSIGSAQEILSGFFNLQLWNERVKDFKIMSRISEGLFLVYLELNRYNLLSLPRYCYLAVSAYRTAGDTLLTMRAMNKDHFDKPLAKTWLDCSLLVQVKTTPNAPTQKLLTAVLTSPQPSNFHPCLSFLSQLRVFQSLLRTSITLPPFPLDWLHLS